MNNRVAVFGGSFNPPGQHHRDIAVRLLQEFSKVLIVPCGSRPDKRQNDGLDSLHRAAMVDMTFGDLPNVEVLMFDMEKPEFTRTEDLDQLLGSYGELWHVVGGDLVKGGDERSELVRTWHHGQNLWQQLRFAVVDRDGFPLTEADLPPQSVHVSPGHVGSSTDIRSRLFNWQPVTGLVVPRVEQYIERHGLYRGTLPRTLPMLHIPDPRIMLVVDEWKAGAVATATALRDLVDERQPNMIVVVGGDGTMLHAIRQHWRRRLPFIGLNYGKVGYLLNSVPEQLDENFFRQDFIIRQSPLLYVEYETWDGKRGSDLAFNDAYVVTKPGKAIWVEVSVNGEVMFPELKGDGVLVATAAGSTSYAKAMGATPILIGTPNIVLAGSNVYDPPNWHSAHLQRDSVVTLRSVDPTAQPKKRPMLGFVDGIELDEISVMTIRTSRVASVEIGFQPDDDLHRKLNRIQFQEFQRS